MRCKQDGFLYETAQARTGETDIVKINISDFKAEAVGIVPGQLLNQFSIDEYEGNLRSR